MGMKTHLDRRSRIVWILRSWVSRLRSAWDASSGRALLKKRPVLSLLPCDELFVLHDSFKGQLTVHCWNYY